jgi:hypothetical protein
MPNPELKDMPPAAAVQVLRWKKNERSGEMEPWPVATITIDVAGRIVFNGDASKAYETLLRATKKCAARLVDQTMREAAAEAQQLKADSDL